MYKYMEKTLIDKMVQEILESPSNQLKIIQHFYPNAVNGEKKFKTHNEETPSSTLKLDNGKYFLKNFGTGDKAEDCFNIIESQLGVTFAEAVSYACKDILKSSFDAPPNKGNFSTFQKRVANTVRFVPVISE